MSSRAVRGAAVRSYRRRKTALDLDLNRAPPGENREQEGSSNQLAPQVVQAGQQPQSVQPAMIDVEAIDDDVVESTPRAFAEAKNNSRRNRGRIVVDLVNSELPLPIVCSILGHLHGVKPANEDRGRVNNNNRNKRRRDSASEAKNCEIYINLESSSSSMREYVTMAPEPSKEPVFNCPICMGPLVEEMSTRCGHIFCKNCIKAAISVQNKCPTCRKKVTVKELIRVFLPSTS